MKNVLTFILLVLALQSPCFGQKPYRYTPPQPLDDGWKTGNLESKQIDTSKIHQLFNQLQGGQHKIHSILLAKDGELLIEEYFGDYGIDKPHDLRSVTKSFTSLLMGIAIEKGYIDSVDDPISKYVKHPTPKKNLDPRKAQITIKHLLTMSTGLDCNDWDKKSRGQEDKVYRKGDWLQYFLDLPMLHEPGTVSNYCTMGQVFAMEIISRASGMEIDVFAQNHLFDPLGIHNLRWGHTSSKAVIPSGKRLYMTSRDMAKIGQLVLNKGKWNNKQLISPEWMELTTSAKTKITGRDYGFLWWNFPFKVNEQVTHAKVATGNGGQFIMVFPKEKIVAVFTGGAYNSEESNLPFAIVSDVFLPTFKSEK